MKIVAIDPSLARTGIAYSSSEGKAVCCSISSKPTDYPSETARISGIADRILQVVTENDPHVIAIESALMGSGHGVQMGVLFLQAVLRDRIFRLRSVHYITAEIVEIHSSQRRKYACGSQKDRDKDQVLLAANNAAGLGVINNNDEADAWWMWKIIHDAYHCDAESVALYRQEVLANLSFPTVDDDLPVWAKPKKLKARKTLV